MKLLTSEFSRLLGSFWPFIFSWSTWDDPDAKPRDGLVLTLYIYRVLEAGYDGLDGLSVG